MPQHPPESPAPDREASPKENRRRWPKRLKRLILIVTPIAAIAGTAGAAYLWYFVNTELSPLVGRELSKLFDRPVNVGPVQRVSLTGIRVGESTIPATATDPDRAIVPAVEVGFDPLQFLLTRTLSLDVTLLDPQLYLEQRRDEAWLKTTLHTEDDGKDSAIEIQLDAIRFRDGQLTLQPNAEVRAELLDTEPKPIPPVVVTPLDGQALFLDNQKRIAFEVTGTPATGGELDIDGEVLVDTLDIKLGVRARDLSGPNIMPLIPNLPIAVFAGTLGANLTLTLRETEVLQWQGIASFNDITARLATLEPNLTQATGRLRFWELKVALEDTRAFYGELFGTAAGTIDTTADYNLNIQLPPTTLEKVTNTLDLATPVPVAGEIAGDFQVTGPLEAPIFSGTVANTKVARIDKIDFDRLRGEIRIDAIAGQMVLESFIGEPVAGGRITGSGAIPLAPDEGMSLNFTARNLPGDALGEVYSGGPLDVAIGPIQGRARVRGTPENPVTFVNWDAREGDYPASGEIVVTGAISSFRNTRIQVPGGELQVTGSANQQTRLWQAFVTADELALAPLLPPGSPSVEGAIAANVQLSGTLDSFELGEIDAEGGGFLSLGDRGTVAATGSLQNGRWTAQIATSDLSLNPFVPDLAVPVGLPSAEIDLAGRIDSFDPAQLAASGTATVRIAGGTLQTEGQVDRGNFQLAIAASEIPVDRLAEDLPVPIRLNAGKLRVSGNLADLNLGAIAARTEFDAIVAGAPIRGNGQLDRGDFQLALDTANLQLNPFAPALPVPVELVEGELTVFGNVNRLDPAQVRATTRVALDVAETRIAGTGQLNRGDFELSLRGDRLSLNRFSPDLPVPVEVRDAELTVLGNLADLDPNQIAASGSARVDLAGGELLANGTVKAGGFQGAIAASGLDLTALAPDLPVPVTLVGGRAEVAGRLDDLDPQNIDGTATVALAVAGGRVKGEGSLQQGQWQGAIAADGLNLNAFAPQLTESLELSTGTVNLSGSLASFSLADLRADGNLSAALSAPVGTDSPLSPFATSVSPFRTSFRWTGEVLQIREAIAPGLSANGSIFVDVAGVDFPQISGFDFNLQLNRFNLDGLPIPGGNPLALMSPPGEPVPPLVAGSVEFVGRLRGEATPTEASPLPNVPFALSLMGEMQLHDFALATLQFEPLLSGPVAVDTREGVNVSLKGENDEIAVSLNRQFLPESFSLRQGEIVARGRLQGDEFAAVARNFPLALLNLAPAPDLGFDRVAGSLSGSVRFNLATSRGLADLEITDPAIGYITLKRFAGRIYYEDGIVALDEGSLALGESLYRMEGRLAIADNPQFQGKIAIDRGRIQDLLEALKLFEIDDFLRAGNPPEYADARAIVAQAVGLPQASLENQLRRFSEITALVRQNAILRQAPGIPELADVRGEVTGALAFNGSLEAGLQMSFDLEARQVEWRPQRPYQEVVGDRVVLQENRIINIDRALLRGTLNNEVLTLNPLRIEAEDTLVSFVGTVGGQKQSGRLEVSNLSVADLRNFAELPPGIALTGLLNLKANLAGSLENPQARGELSFLEGTINRESIPGVRGGFSYANSRLTFSSFEPSAVQITGSVPIPPSPGNDAIRLDVDIENRGLTLVNLLSANQVEWVDGTGKVQFEARGRLNAERGAIEELVARGTATIENATINAQALPEPLTNVTGTARFETDRIIVEGVQGEFSEGQVVASGVLPIFLPLEPEDKDRQNPLTVGLDRLAVNLKGLYRGGVDGGLLVGGTALAPEISGELRLADGVVLLPTEETQTAPPPPAEGDISEAFPGPEYKNLRVILGPNLEIASPPLLSFAAVGDLTINGFLDDLRPRGTIRLERGQVNLFATQFRLVRSYENIAVFQGNLDPFLDVRLLATVREVNRANITSDPNSSEINEAIDTNILGSVRTIRVQAQVTGDASQLDRNLQLTSSPSRTEQEIVALIGGGFINTLGQGDTTLALANLAGGALLSGFQNTIANALRLSEFRLSPAIVKSGSSDQLALEAEAGLDITRKFSVSIQRILLDKQPTQLNLRYRVNDRIMLRGSTDFDEDNRALVEYEFRF
ncbi:translocation/assembly module TamB domain-containing protein [Oxynema sp. CENA135]|uniref:translocation/assembly module TamB domain-containing protein n=1 Tax=Oxynema sp. CENA135 TaxID=984206 RepID=UPI00190D5181|nr:translocation/assembly module TamB domain-containing protein [Oxynema sp. CENA135]MBK4731128.1 translocation/assembly module TamB domain-containing protein [Oxynema sp. CENA135]